MTKISERTSRDKINSTLLQKGWIADSGDINRNITNEARELSEKNKNKLDGNSPFVADSYNCLGALYASTGRLAEAKLYYEQALAIQQRTLLASDPRLAQTRQQYADVILKLHQR